MMKVLILSKYSRMGASSRLRTLQYIPCLESQGIKCTVQSLFDDAYLQGLYAYSRRAPWAVLRLYLRRLIALLGVFRYDLIWIEYEIFPYLPAFAERLLRLLGKTYVVDYDDAIFHNYDRSTNPLIRTLMGRKIDVVMRNSACVIAGNNYLAERARIASARCVELVPTVVDHARYSVRTVTSEQQPVIGWIGSPSTQHFVVGIREALTKVCHAHGARLLLVGATSSVAAEFPGVDVEVLPWTEGGEVEFVQRMDIGIMPLTDGPWEKGKCGYKLIQYMACGVPVIASPVGVNVSIVNGSHCGLLAQSQAEWEVALMRLLQSADERIALGKAGRKAVTDIYSLQIQAPIMMKILSAALKQGSN